MRPAVRALAAFLMFAIAPGALEATEDAVHVVVDGHTVDDHALVQHEEGHGGSHDEHKCTVTFHVCACHASATFVDVKQVVVMNGAVESPLALEAPAPPAVHVPTAHLDAPFRPPIA